MKHLKLLFTMLTFAAVGAAITWLVVRQSKPCESITSEQEEILSIVDSALSLYDPKESLVSDRAEAVRELLSKPIDYKRAVMMTEECYKQLSKDGGLKYVEPQVSVIDLLKYFDLATSGDYSGKGLVIYPALEGNKLIQIVCISKEYENYKDRAYYKFSNLDYRYGKQMLISDTINRAEAVGLIKTYYQRVKIGGSPQNETVLYKTSHYYNLEDIKTYLKENGYYDASESDKSEYWLEFNHGYISSAMASALFSLGGHAVVEKADDLIGYSGFLELYDKIGSVTRTKPEQDTPTRKFGIEEIGKPCPPRCEQFAGITKSEF